MAGGIGQRSGYIEGMKATAYGYYLDATEYDPEPSIYEQLCDVKTSNKAYEQSTSVVEASDPIEREESDELTAIIPIEGFSTFAKMREFYKMTAISRETVEDHQRFTNFMKDVTRGWANDMKRGKNKQVLNHFNYGGYTAGHDATFDNTITGVLSDPSGDGIYDGTTATPQALFGLSGDTHASKAGGTYYNAIASTLTEANFETLWNLMTVTNSFNEDDTEISIVPDMLLCSKSLEFTARRILESTLIPGSANNDKNVLNGIVNLLATNYFSDTDAWVLLKAKKGLIFYRRETPVIDIWYEHKNKTHYMSVSERFGIMVKNWRFFASSNLDTS